MPASFAIAAIVNCCRLRFNPNVVPKVVPKAVPRLVRPGSSISRQRDRRKSIPLPHLRFACGLRRKLLFPWLHCHVSQRKVAH